MVSPSEDFSTPVDSDTGIHPDATEAEQQALPPALQWEKIYRHWLSFWHTTGQTWCYAHPKCLPAFWLHPDTEAHRYRAAETLPSNLPEALATQTSAWKVDGVRTPARYTIPRVLPQRGELLGTVTWEHRKCGDESCRCTSGRKEDQHGPYPYRRYRDPDGTLRRTYVPKNRVEAVKTGVQARQQRAERQRKMRDLYLEKAHPSGETSVRHPLDGVVSAETYNRAGNPAEQFAHEAFGENDAAIFGIVPG